MGTWERAAGLLASAAFVVLGFGGNILLADPAGAIHYPELLTLPPSDIGIEYDPTTGRKLLRFSNGIANVGEGPLDVVPTNNAATGTTDAYQRLYSHDENGNWYVARTDYVGTFVFHPQHHHWHFEDFARYELHDIAPDGSVGSTVLASSQKVGFCLTDSQLINSSLEHVGTETYVDCDPTNAQGISVGWADIYDWTLEGQSLDITGLPDGGYWLVSTADPDNLLNEGGGAAETNNTAAVKVQIASEIAWIDDALPEGAITYADNDSWTWTASDPAPYSGSLAHQSDIATGFHEHYFECATARLVLNPGNVLFAYVYLDPANLPSEVMLAWSDGAGWFHRAYWGANLIDIGVNQTASRLYMGPLPPAGQWVRLEVPANRVDLGYTALTAMAFTLFNGRAWWDYAGVSYFPVGAPPPDSEPPMVTITAPASNATVSGVVVITADASDNVGVAGLQFKVDGANLGTEITAPPYNLAWITAATTNGSHTLSAVARDAAGNQVASMPITVVVSNAVSGSAPPVPPVCNTGGPYVAGCLRAITQLELGGSQSIDPDGAALTYAWTTDCPNAAFDDPSSPTPVLSVESTSVPIRCNVMLTVTNAGGLSSRSGTTVTISDTTPPAIRCPAALATAPDPGRCSAVVNYAVAATDNCSDPTVVCSPLSGSIFPKGVTTVECAATDAAGNTATCSFTVTVNDTATLELICPANVETPTDPGRCTANVTFQPTASVDCPELTFRCIPPSGASFPIGTSTVNCFATDASDTTAQCAFVVTVTSASESPLAAGFWKKYPDAWPSRPIPMTLGTQSYSESELLAILSASTSADASLVLARQLITATFNTANGSDPRPVCDALSEAHRLLSGFDGKLPYKVARSSGLGRAMIDIADLLERYNRGL